MLTYNTHLSPLILPQYGRQVQKMVEHCKTIEDREERNACARSIVESIRVLFPPTNEDAGEYDRKVWDHLAIMAGFDLDIDWPFEMPESNPLETPPDKLNYSGVEIKRRQYGHIIDMMVAHATEMAPGEERDALVMLLANHMKKLMLAVDKDGVDDARIFNDLRVMTRGSINLNPDEVHLHEFSEAPTASKKKKKKKK